MQDLRGKLSQQEFLAKHTTWRVGGPADWFYEPADVIDLARFMQQLPKDTPILYIGLGSNLLVRDGGIRGTVILTTGLLKQISLIDKQLIYVEAGVSCAKLARFAARHELSGSEFLAGIPGTIGGALALNAGAWGNETWSLVTYVETINRQGQRQQRTVNDYKIGYRQVTGPPDEWFIAATLQLAHHPGLVTENQAKMRTLLKQRNNTQPIGLPSCGSVFRNPPGDYAARLIEQAGWKGKRIGGAYVSDKHANFIINDGKATAADIETLIEQIRHSIKQNYGIELMTEVHIVGQALNH